MAVRPAPRLSKAVSRYRSASPSSWNCHASTVSPAPQTSRTSGPSPTCSVQMSMPLAATCPAMSGLRLLVPPLHVLPVRAEVRARREEPVVELEVQVMGLHVVEDEQGRHRPRELAEGVQHVLRLQRDQRLEALVVDLRAATEAGAVGPRARCPGVERATRAELAGHERLDRRGHVGVVRWAEGLEDAAQAGGVGRGPAVVLVVPE